MAAGAQRSRVGAWVMVFGMSVGVVGAAVAMWRWLQRPNTRPAALPSQQAQLNVANAPLPAPLPAALPPPPSPAPAVLAPPAPRVSAASRSSLSRFSLSTCRGRRVSCFGNALLDSTGAVIPDALPVLFHLAQNCDLYLICQATDAAGEAQTLKTLEETGLLSAGLDRNKVLFSSVPIGRAHMARQLEVHAHIDTDTEVIRTLQPHVLDLVLIGPPQAVPDRVNVIPAIYALAK